MNNIREWRIKNGKTQKELGELLGVSTKTVQDWEYKRSSPDRRSRIAIDRIIGDVLEVKS